MPPRESTSRPERTNVYSVLLVVSAAFLLLAVLITLSELRTDYDFMGQETFMAPMGDDPIEEIVDEPMADPEPE